MAEKRFYWLKLKEDYFNNPKIKKLRKIAGGDTFTIVYLKMQLLSVSNKGIIEFEGIEETFEEELALKLDEDLDNVSVTLNFLKIQGLIESNNNEFLLLEACKNIGSESESAERVRLFREREKQKTLQCNNDVTCVKQSSISISNSISSSISNNKEGTCSNIYGVHVQTHTKDISINNKSIINKVSKGRAFTPPTFEEIEEYAISRGYQHLAKKFFEYYTTGDWRDSKGNKIKNWKQKFITWEGDRTQTKKPEPKNNNKRAYSTSEIEQVFKSIEELEL